MHREGRADGLRLAVKPEAAQHPCASPCLWPGTLTRGPCSHSPSPQRAGQGRVETAPLGWK